MARRSLVLAVALTVLVAGCSHGAAPQIIPGKPYPHGAPEAGELRARGERFTNQEIRAWYLVLVGEIAVKDRALAASGSGAEVRGRAAFAIRHEARRIARAMMGDASEVEDLRARDHAIYGTEDGPTIEWLLAKSRARGLDGDAAWLAIVESAQRTNGAVNDLMGVR